MSQNLSSSEKEELKNIGMYQPVFSGDTLSHQTAKSLCAKGLALQYEGDYCLTEKGKDLFSELYPKEIIGGKLSTTYNPLR